MPTEEDPFDTACLAVDVESDPAGPGIRRRRWVSEIATIVAIVAIVGVGATSALGVRSDTVSARGGGYELVVEYADVTRGGMATPLTFHVTAASRLPDRVRVAVPLDYLELFDLHGMQPVPVAEQSDGDRIVWEFETTGGRELRARLDFRVDPAVQRGTSATVSVLGDDDRPAVSVRFQTTVLP